MTDEKTPISSTSSREVTDETLQNPELEGYGSNQGDHDTLDEAVDMLAEAFDFEEIE